jgi:protein gp37
MSATTNIAWCDSTWNPWHGCTKVSAGCANCYAETMSRRNPAVLGVWGPGKPRVRAVPASFNAPLKWNKKPWVCARCGQTFRANESHDPCGHWTECENHRRRVFSLSLGDWLDTEVPIEWLADMLDVIRRCPDLDFLLLTKRPESWHSRLSAINDLLQDQHHGDDRFDLRCWVNEWLYEQNINVTGPANDYANIWLGVTVENQEQAHKRIPELLKIPAKVRFLSVEPLLEPVDLIHWLSDFDSDNGIHSTKPDWCIVGGESGPKARPCAVEWIRSIVQQCVTHNVPCFVKQLGSNTFADRDDLNTNPKTIAYTLHPCDRTRTAVFSRWHHPKGGDPAEWPADLRCQEFPKVNR